MVDQHKKSKEVNLNFGHIYYGLVTEQKLSSGCITYIYITITTKKKERRKAKNIERERVTFFHVSLIDFFTYHMQQQGVLLWRQR